jgi:hypothetical protein
MDIMLVLGLVMKGLSVVDTLITVGKNAAPAIKVVKDLVTGAQAGTLTDDDLTKTEAILDALIDDFNKPIE